MTDIKLSICIPTYNREAYLRNALSCCERDLDFDFPYEIVISDNASTDNTPQVVEEFIARGLPIRYHRRAVNGGPGPNMTCAFQHAIGEYSVYLADDDLLISEGVKSVVAYLDANPDVVACHAPWYLYDEVNDKDLNQFYQVDYDRKFFRGRFAELFDFIYQRHIFAEIAIYRSSALRSAWVPRDFCCWAFSYLAHFLEQGAVAFLKKPFYRFVTVSKIAPNRQQVGHNDVMTSWDKYRGGLEYFLYIGMKRGNIRNTRDSYLAYEEKCRKFTLERMAVAIRFWVAHRDFIKAYELYTRMVIGGMGNHPIMASLRDILPLSIAIQTLVFRVNATAGISRLMLAGLPDPNAVTEMLRREGLDDSIEVLPESAEHEAEYLEKTSIFISDQSLRQKFEALGYKPNLIFCDADLIQGVIM